MKTIQEHRTQTKQAIRIFGISFLFICIILLVPKAIQAATVGADTFSRTSSNSWRTADTGGAYTLVGNNANFSVNGSAGLVSFSFAGITREAYLASISETDQDLTAQFSLNGIPTGGGYTVDLVGRRINGNNSYRARAEVKSDGAVIIRLISQNGGAEQVLSSYAIQDFTYTANTALTVRARFVGTHPTTLDMKVWRAGTAEPDWQIKDIEDGTAALQGGGSAGIRTSSSADSNTLTVSFDNIEFTDGNFVNTAPVVDAGSDLSVSLPNAAEPEATVADDSFPANPLNLAWSEVSGPGTVTFSPSNAVERPSVTFSSPGTYVLELSADDGEFSDSDTLTVTVEANTAPLVNAGNNQTIHLPANSAFLNGSVNDNAPNALSYSWTVVSAPEGAQAGSSYLFTSPNTEDTGFTMPGNIPGNYVLRFTVVDNNGEFSATDTVSIALVLPDNAAPVVDAGTNATVTLPDTTVNLSGTVVDDGLPVGEVLTRHWSLLSGPGAVSFSDTTALSPLVTFTSNQTGDYIFALTVSDGVLETVDTVTITFTNNGPPLVDAGLPQIITLPDSAFLNATVTDDGKLSPVTYNWTKQSGPGAITFTPNASVEDPQVAFSQPGTYVLYFSVFDGEFTETDTVTVTVQPDPATSPVPTPQQIPVYRFYSATFKSHFYTANSTERDHVIDAYDDAIWKFEGEAYRVYDRPGEGLVAVYRFYSARTRSHFYTANQAERDSIIATYPEAIWKYEGVAWYAYSDSANEGSAMYRFWNGKDSKHFYTANQMERDHVRTNLGLIYRYEGVAYKVP